MARWMGGGRGGAGWTRRRGPRRRAVGCLVWILALVVVLLLLSLIFGGFQKGTKVGGSGPGHRLQPAAQELQLGRVTAAR
jgi:hypothetical protein